MVEQVFSKTVENAGWGEGATVKHDFVAQSELTVTITLSEYRELIQQKGAYEKKLAEARSESSECRLECQRLKQAIEALRRGPEDDGEQ